MARDVVSEAQRPLQGEVGASLCSDGFSAGCGQALFQCPAEKVCFNASAVALVSHSRQVTRE